MTGKIFPIVFRLRTSIICTRRVSTAIALNLTAAVRNTIFGFKFAADSEISRLAARRARG